MIITQDVILMGMISIIIAIIFSTKDIARFFVYIFLLMVTIIIGGLLDTNLILVSISPLPFLRVLISAIFYMLIYSSIIYILKE